MYSPVRMIPHVWHLKQLTCHCFSSARRDWPCLISSLQPAQSGVGGQKGGGTDENSAPGGSSLHHRWKISPAPACPQNESGGESFCWGWHHGIGQGSVGLCCPGLPWGTGMGSAQQSRVEEGLRSPSLHPAPAQYLRDSLPSLLLLAPAKAASRKHMGLGPLTLASHPLLPRCSRFHSVAP